MTTIGLKGGKELSAFLDAFPAKLQKGAVKAALTAAAKPIRDQARANAPKESGEMAKSIRTGSPDAGKDGRVTIRIRLKGEHSYLGTFIEYGVAPHFIRAGDAYASARVLTRQVRAGGVASDVETHHLKIAGKIVTGAVLHPGLSARPFLRPALDAKAQDAIRAFGDRISSYLKSKTGFSAPAVLEADEE